MKDKFIYKLSERTARLEERLYSSDKALALAQKTMDSKWPNVISLISVFIAALALIVGFYRR